jgi:hypothetical protein
VDEESLPCKDTARRQACQGRDQAQAEAVELFYRQCRAAWQVEFDAWSPLLMYVVQEGTDAEQVQRQRRYLLRRGNDMNSNSPKHELSNDEFDTECNKVAKLLGRFFDKNDVDVEIGQTVLANLLAAAFYAEGLTQFQAINAFTTIVKHVYAREDRKNER